jgi:xylan 1,4-beta-xylosidase
LVVSHEVGKGRVLGLMSCPGNSPLGDVDYPGPQVTLADGPVDLRVVVDHAAQQFYWRQGDDWQPIGPMLDASVISDEGGLGEHGSFTGAFVGMLAYDLTGQGREARFARFGYRPGVVG